MGGKKGANMEQDDGETSREELEERLSARGGVERE